ncbi:MAG TPA: rRNA maturation RNase YbeY [Candidatus Acidoferrales bacterium]|nr:rRNA maturation RNase YbeY [Candidatus Acidoferrales bacterium]
MISNRQRRIRLPLKKLERFLARARREVRLPADSLAICFVSNAEIERWNRSYRHKQGPTDVLSFPADDTRPTTKRTPTARRSRSSARSATFIGDIAIAPEVARRNARRFGRTLEDEMRILILHGILHLMGYDHETDTGQMDRRERRLRRTLGLA